MIIGARFIVLFIIVISTYACTYFLLIHWSSFSPSLIYILSSLPVLPIIYLSIRFIKNEVADNLINTMFSTSFIFGLVGLLGGSIGAIILMPSAQLGFLLGFWTGPLGFLSGVFISLFRWIITEKRNKNK